MSSPELLSVAEVAESLKVSKPVVYRWLRQGLLPAMRIGGIIRVRPADVAAFVNAHVTTRPRVQSMMSSGGTDKARQALRILADHGPLTSAEFARLMWPDSPGWEESRDRVVRAGGAYLGRLRKMGWVHRDPESKKHSLAAKGESVLACAEAS